MRCAIYVCMQIRILHGAPETQPLLLLIYACIFPNYVSYRVFQSTSPASCIRTFVFIVRVYCKWYVRRGGAGRAVGGECVTTITCSIRACRSHRQHIAATVAVLKGGTFAMEKPFSTTTSISINNDPKVPTPKVRKKKSHSRRWAGWPNPMQSHVRRQSDHGLSGVAPRLCTYVQHQVYT